MDLKCASKSPLSIYDLVNLPVEFTAMMFLLGAADLNTWKLFFDVNPGINEPFFILLVALSEIS